MKARSKKPTPPAKRIPVRVPTAGDESSRSAAPAAPAKPEVAPFLKPNIPYNDLREWIAEAEKLDEVRVVRGASWQQDIGIAAEIVMHSDAAPCVIFDDVPGSPQGFRVLSNFFGGKRKNMTLGYPTHLSKLE